MEGGAALTSSTPDALWRAPAAHAVGGAAVTCEGVSRGTLLDDCSFRIAPGVRLLVVADPDESGSMLLRVLAGLTRASAGRAEVAGLGQPADARRGARVAYVAPHPAIYPWMTPREAVNISARLLELGTAATSRRVREALAWVELPRADLDRPIRRCSLGVAQRADLATALVGAPEVLLLDEPLRALAPDERQRLLRLPGRRLTMLLASRYPRSEAGIATHVLLIRDGRVALLATIAQLEASGYRLSREGIAAFADRRPAPPPVDASVPTREPVAR